jgi:hypothetical protein
VTESTGTNQTTVSVRGRITGVEVTVTFQVLLDELKKQLAAVLEQLTELGIEVEATEDAEDERHHDDRRAEDRGHGDGPIPRLARELEVNADEIKKVLGIKGEQVDLYRASRLKVSDALSAICYAYEKGLVKGGMSYETFRSLVEANQIKMKTPLPTVCFNLIQSGRIDRKQYDDAKVIVLTPEGERKAADTLKALIAGSARERPTAGAKKKVRSKGSRGRRSR